MSVWKVYSKDGGIERCELHAVEYGGTYMGERAVTATFTSPCEIEFGIFDYIIYRDEKFEIEAIPTVKKVSSFEYIYELRFVSLKYELERCEMRDLVPYDNDVVYPTPLTFSFTGNVRYLTERIQACLDSLYGDGVWNIVVGDGVESEEKNVTIAQQNCWNALALVYSIYGLDFHIKGRTITIGETLPLVDHVFEYGKGNGLYEIERASDTDTGIVTKLRAFGGTRNLDYSYPKRPEWDDSVLPVSFAFSPLRLMLPSFKKDGKTDYILADADVIARYGVREASIIYEDIYPSITGATHNGQAIDRVKSVEAVDDNSGTFVVHLYDLGFDLEEHLTTGEAQISMKTGAMQGYTFTMTSIEKQEDGSNKITLNRVSAEGGENYNIPNSDWNMKAGDKFVLLNILMPQKYIRDAEKRLEARAKEYLGQYAKTNFSYNIGLHDKFLVQNPSVYDSLIEGAKLSVYDGELGIDEEVTIQSITITENAEDNILPQVKVTLNNQPSASTLDRIQGRIDSLANETAAGNFATQSEIMAQYRKKLDKPFFDKLFVAVGFDGEEIASTDVTTPVAYIKAKYNFAAVGGITSFAMGEEVNVTQIYDDLPIDNQTLYWEEVEVKVENEETGEEEVRKIKVLKAKTVTTLGGLLNVGEWADQVSETDRIMVQKAGSEVWGGMDIANIGTASFENIEEYGEGNAFTSFLVTKGEEGEKLYLVKDKTFAEQSYLEDKYFTKDDASGLFVTLDDTVQIIQGVKFFSEGLYIGTSKIWQSQNDVVYIDANLVVRGSVTMYGLNEVDIPTIMAGVAVDDKTITKRNGYLEVIGGGGGGGSIEYPLSWSGYSSGSWDGSEAKNIYIPSKVSELANDSLFINLSGLDSYIKQGGYITEAYVTSRGYITASALSDYLPLTGGTITGDLSVNGTLKSNIVRSIYNRLLIADNGTNIISIGGNYAGMITEFNGEKFKFWANGTEISVIDDKGVTVRKRIWCQHSVVALYFQSLEACETSANTTGHFRMGRFDESDGGFKMQFGGTGTTGTLQVIDQQWTKSLFKLDKSGNGDFAGYMTCRGNLNISGASGVNTSINFYSYDQSGYQFSNRVYDDKTLSIYYRSSAGAFTEVMKISATGLTEMIGYNDPVLSLRRTHPDGGAYINFCSKNQKTIRIAAGSDTSYRFSVWYQNTAQGIDKYIMHVDPSGNLLAYGGITMYSDERKKTILNHVQLSLREVADAPLIEHYYNSDSEKTTHVGSIAQYWAGLNDWFCKMDTDGFYTMEVQNAALASAISVARELLKYETKTDKQIRKLKKRISELEEEVELLKKM